VAAFGRLSYGIAVLHDVTRAARGRPRRLALGSFLVVAALCGGCSDKMAQTAAGLTGGDTQRGRETIERHRCGSCHTIAGIRGANGLVGPPLHGVASRAHLAGRLPNTPANLLRWIKNPQAVKPGNVMPDMGIGDRDARDISAYLYTLR